jgi:hypothetical protein
MRTIGVPLRRAEVTPGILARRHDERKRFLSPFRRKQPAWSEAAGLLFAV